MILHLHIMFMIEVIYADNNIKNLLATHHFNHIGKLTLDFVLSLLLN